MMTSHNPLAAYLKDVPGSVCELTLSFRLLEAILSPVFAGRKELYRAWWNNPLGLDRFTQVREWVATGWEVASIDRCYGWVCFKRR